MTPHDETMRCQDEACSCLSGQMGLRLMQLLLQASSGILSLFPASNGGLLQAAQLALCCPASFGLPAQRWQLLLCSFHLCL